MESLNYHAELAKHYPHLAQKRPKTITLYSKKLGEIQAIATPYDNGTHIGVEFMQGAVFKGFRTVGLNELEQIWRAQEKENERD